MFRRPSILAALAVAILWFCQFLTVHYNYGGNWTGLFCISPDMPVPGFLHSERLFIFQNTNGYDGQIFHLIAHDPWMTRGSAALIDQPAFRYQRILVPALAWTLALGRDPYVHAAYFAVILGFAYLGVFWLARLAQLRSLHPAWGLVFMAVPATITSADRMTADIALAALCVGFAYYAARHSFLPVVLILACAALARETALPIAVGYNLFLLSRRQWWKAASIAAAMLPAGAWFLYVTRGTAQPHVVSYFNAVPFYGLVERFVHPVIYTLGPWKSGIAVLFDYIALAGIVLVLLAAVRMAIKKQWTPATAATYALAFTVLFLGHRDVWQDAFSFGRVLSPLLLLAFIEQVRESPIAALMPMAMVDSRIALNLAVELEGVMRGLLK